MAAVQSPYDNKYEKDFAHVEQHEVVNGGIKPGDLESGSNIGDGIHRQWKDVDEGLDPKEVSRIVRKIDWRLLPILGAMYTISQIDRSNLSLARSANSGKMNAELGFDANNNNNNRYSLVTLAFFIPYLVLEIPVSYLS